MRHPPARAPPCVPFYQFRKLGYEVIDWIADYFSRDLEASRVKPGRCSTDDVDGGVTENAPPQGGMSRVADIVHL